MALSVSCVTQRKEKRAAGSGVLGFLSVPARSRLCLFVQAPARDRIGLRICHPARAARFDLHQTSRCSSSYRAHGLGFPETIVLLVFSWAPPDGGAFFVKRSPLPTHKGRTGKIPTNELVVERVELGRTIEREQRYALANVAENGVGHADTSPGSIGFVDLQIVSIKSCPVQ
jgi:hypothetical protein